MKTSRSLAFLAASVLVVGLVTAASGHDPSGKHESDRHASEEAMKAQHERMAAFQSAARTLGDAIILGSTKMAQEGASQILKSLESHEKDVPHKNRARIKEFHALHVEMGKRTQRLQATVTANQLPGAALAYGRVLEICATCHKLFRD